MKQPILNNLVRYRFFLFSKIYFIFSNYLYENPMCLIRIREVKIQDNGKQCFKITCRIIEPCDPMIFLPASYPDIVSMIGNLRFVLGSRARS